MQLLSGAREVLVLGEDDERPEPVRVEHHILTLWMLHNE